MRNNSEKNFIKTVLTDWKNEPTIVQVDSQSKCMAFPSLLKDFHQQKVYDMSKEVLGVETPLR
jgi:hypothetical protein